MILDYNANCIVIFGGYMGGKSAVKSIGERFGRLVVVDVSYPDRTPQSVGHALVVAACDCGGTWRGGVTVLRTGVTKSCGCLSSETTSKRNQTHGMSGSKESSIWKAMLNRCRNEAGQDYYLYGGKGIEVCARWHDFVNFYADMGPIPPDKSSIDRIDSDGNYEPGNCRWATALEQGRNTSRVRLVEHLGRTQALTAWCEELNMNYHTTRSRLASGWSTDRAFATPIAKTKSGKLFEYEGQTMTLAEWSRHLGIGATTLHYRLNMGFPPEAVFTASKF